MTTLTASKARQQLPEALNQVAYGGERIVIKRRGKVLAVLVSKDVFALLETIDDRMDIKEVKKALADAKRKGQESILWERAKKKLGL